MALEWKYNNEIFTEEMIGDNYGLSILSPTTQQTRNILVRSSFIQPRQNKSIRKEKELKYQVIGKHIMDQMRSYRMM